MPRIFDLLLLFLLCPIVFPVFVFVILICFIFHGKNIFFVQQRLGRSKKVFHLYKFRSMIVNAQSMGTGLNSYTDDPRITKLGKFLRKTSLDELPQLINVVKGEMSFIGPRPSVVGELELEVHLPENIDLRFSVRPGLTGWAQIHGRDNLSWFEKATLDIYFVKLKGYKRIFAILIILFYTPLYLLNFSATYEKRKP
jgi:undecaprenyl phosphate N,N'-diacetylbacillosamine 1-phosphate transferase